MQSQTLNEIEFTPEGIDSRLGFLDDLEVSQVRDFEKALIADLRANHADILGTIDETGKIDDDTKAALTAAVKTFKEGFVNA